MAKRRCLECYILRQRVVEIERRIARWKAYAQEKGLSPALRQAGIEKLTPKDFLEMVDEWWIHKLRC